MKPRNTEENSVIDFQIDWSRYRKISWEVTIPEVQKQIICCLWENAQPSPSLGQERGTEGRSNRRRILFAIFLPTQDLTRANTLPGSLPLPLLCLLLCPLSSTQELPFHQPAPEKGCDTSIHSQPLFWT